MRTRRSLGYGAYGQNPFTPNFVVCKSEGGTANCPSEYVKEFSGIRGLSDFIPEFSGVTELLNNRVVMVIAGIAGAALIEGITKKPIVEVLTMGLVKIPRFKY